ncbi:MAG: hypothetical protein ACOX9C_06520 [Kiritimatiellia bacterium]|jgi:hypothetical protein
MPHPATAKPSAEATTLVEAINRLAAAIEKAAEPVAPEPPKRRFADGIVLEKKSVTVGVLHVARRLGVSKSHMSRVLAGKRHPGPELAARMKRLGIEAPEVDA